LAGKVRACPPQAGPVAPANFSQYLHHPRAFERPALHRPVLQGWSSASGLLRSRAFQRPSRLGLSHRRVSPLKRARAMCAAPHSTSPKGLAYPRQDKRVETRS